MNSSTDKPTILIIDDDAVDRTRFAKMVAPRYVVQQAASATDGLQMYNDSPPACVLLDYLLPDSNAFDALDELVARGAAVIVLTGQDSQQLGLEALRHGAQDFCEKSEVNPDFAEKMILHAIERRRLLDSNLILVSQLQANNQYLDDIAARISEGLCLLSADEEVFEYVSPSLGKICGLPLRDILATPWIQLIHPADRKSVTELFRNSKQQRSEFRVECRIQRPDGSHRQIESESFPVIDERGNLRRYASVVRDVTDARQLQSELELARKLESVGQLAAGIAHEINTPSQYVSDNIRFVKDTFESLLPLLTLLNSRQQLQAEGDHAPPSDELLRDAVDKADLEFLIDEFPEALQQAGDGMNQIRSIVSAMKDFAHPSDTLELANLNRAIESSATVTRNEWKYVADLELDLDANLPAVPCVLSALNQVFLNMIVNAAHAIGEVIDDGEKGTITIRTKADGDNAIIDIEDSGCGMPEDVRQRIFDPFFTTKEVGRGTGQGLAISYAVITERHDGSISVTSKPGQGSRFRISLPLRESQEEEAA